MTATPPDSSRCPHPPPLNSCPVVAHEAFAGVGGRCNMFIGYPCRCCKNLNVQRKWRGRALNTARVPPPSAPRAVWTVSFIFHTSSCCHKIVYHSGHPGYTRSQRSTVGNRGDRHSSIPPLVTKPSNKTSFPTSDPWSLSWGILYVTFPLHFPWNTQKKCSRRSPSVLALSHTPARSGFVLFWLG